jgi:hypothetical protein
MRIEFVTDGVTLEREITFPFLDRTHIFVLVQGSAWPYVWVTPTRIRLQGPLVTNLNVVVQRITPDLESWAEIQNASNLTAEELNRLRRQLLYLIQERSANLGNVAGAFNAVANDLNQIAATKASVDQALAQLTADLLLLDDLRSDLVAVTNTAQTVQTTLLDEIADRVDGDTLLQQQVTNLQTATNGFGAMVTNEAITRSNEDSALAAQITTLDASVDSDVAALNANITSVNQARINGDAALAQSVSSLQATVDTDRTNAQALVNQEASARATADGALQAQYTVKVSTVRGDGRPVVAGIGLAANSSGSSGQSELVLQADRVLIVPGTDLQGSTKPLLAAGNVNGVPTVVIPNALLGDATVDGRLIVNGGIRANHLSVGAASGVNNMLPNSDWTEFTGTNSGPSCLRGWTWIPILGATQVGRNFASGTVWNIGTGGMYMTNLAPGNGGYSGYIARNVFVAGGDTYELSMSLSVHRCTAVLGVAWFTSADQFISENNAPLIDAGGSIIGGSGGPTTMSRVWLQATAPANAAYGNVRLIKGDTNPGQSSSYLFAHRAFMVVLPPGGSITNQTPWNNSSATTEIHGGGIVTDTVKATSLSAVSGQIGLLRSATSGERVEITDGVIRVFDSTNTLRVKLGNLA